MFLVSDDRVKRRRMIARYAYDDMALGVVLAAIDFEWTCRRCILALGTEPTPIIKEDIRENKWVGQALADGWKEKVCKADKRYLTLPNVFDEWASHFCDRFVVWQDILVALSYRNRLVHGAAGMVTNDEGRRCINVFETANDVLCEYVGTVGGKGEKSIFRRISRPRRDKKFGTVGIAERKGREVNFVGERTDEILIDGVRVKKSKIAGVVKDKIKLGKVRKSFLELRKLFALI